jgi:hypothetical protein
MQEPESNVLGGPVKFIVGHVPVVLSPEQTTSDPLLKAEKTKRSPVGQSAQNNFILMRASLRPHARSEYQPVKSSSH